MIMSLAIPFVLYGMMLFWIGCANYHHTIDESEFHIGGRQINFWITAISAHASDMSSWLFLGFPVVVYMNGLSECWVAVGLFCGMWFNWQFVAPRIRRLSEQTQTVTLPSLLSSLTKDTSNWVKRVTCLACLFFFLFYIAAGLKGIGSLLELLFGCPLLYGILLSAFIISFYVMMGGVLAVATADAFQGLFLLASIVLVPLALMYQLWMLDIDVMADIFGGMSRLSMEAVSNWQQGGTTILAWGLGYLGMPHILNKFMSIDDHRQLRKSKYLGLSWQFVALSASASIGLLASHYFSHHVGHGETVFIDIVRYLFSPFIAGFVFCAILSATISTIDSQVMVSATSLVKDLLEIKVTSSVFWTRVFIFLMMLVSSTIALLSQESLHQIVMYAWSGQGSTFGPLVLFVLCGANINSRSAVLAMLVGAFVAAIWPYTGYVFHMTPMIPGFFFGSMILMISLCYKGLDTKVLKSK